MDLKLWMCVLTCLIYMGHVSGKCSITADWADLTMEERLSITDIIVYGKTKEHRASTREINGRKSYFINALFEVYCVIKKTEDPVPVNIIIEAIAPRDGCSGTKSHMQIDNEAIIGLTPSFGGKYIFQEVMPMLSAAFDATKSNLMSVSGICDLQNWLPPTGATYNKCPICGTSNFTQQVMSKDDGEDRVPCFKNGVLVGNLSDCQMAGQVATDSTICIDSDFANTCASLSFSATSVGCTCTNLQMGDTTGPLGEIDAAVTSLPCLFTTTAGLFTSLLVFSEYL